MSDQFTPTGGQTIFPRINFLKTFSSRLEQRIANGRVFLGGVIDSLFGDATLDLDFARTKSIGDLVTYTRASSATYVGSDGLIKTATADTPRFDHDPSTRVSLGLLIEEERTNFVTDSTSSNNWFVITGGTHATSTSVCPDGSTTATRVTGAALNDGAKKNFTAPTSGIHITSYYARTRTGTATIVKTSISGTAGLSVTLPADGSWVRVVGAPSNIGAGSKYLAVLSASAAIDIDVWGLQAELGSFPTSYIPTEGSAVTRAPDIATIEGTNFSSWYNQSEGTVFADFDFLDFTPQPVIWSFKDNLNNSQNYISLSAKSSGQLKYTSNDTGVTQWNKSMVGAVSINTPVRTASVYKTDDIAFSVDGAAVLTDTAATITTAIDRLHLGFLYGPTQQLTGHISRFAYFPTRKTDQELIDLTT